MGTSPGAPNNFGSSRTACTTKKERKEGKKGEVQDANTQNDETRVVIKALELVKVLG